MLATTTTAMTQRRTTSAVLSVLKARHCAVFFADSRGSRGSLLLPSPALCSLAFFRPRNQSASLLTSSAEQISRRSFNSEARTEQNFDANDDLKQYKEKILEASLRKVVQLGWSDEAIGEATREHGLPIALKGLVHGGPSDLIFYFLSKCNRQMSIAMNKEKKEGKLDGLSVKEIVSKCIRTRLELSSPYIASLPQAVKILSHPSNIAASLNSLAELSDEICYLANDNSTNFDWYAKRVVVGGIYSATELFMLTDKSPNFVETWRFLDRRLEDAMQLAGFKDRAETVAGLAATGVCSLLRIAKDRISSASSSLSSSSSSSSSSVVTTPSSTSSASNVTA